MPRYKWNTPHEWLMDAAQSWDSAQLYSALSSIIDKLDADTIQDLYQTEMSEDGYFVDLDEPKSECQNCGETFANSDLLPVTDLEQRVAPGEPMPSGECPNCGALCQQVEV